MDELMWFELGDGRGGGAGFARVERSTGKIVRWDEHSRSIKECTRASVALLNFIEGHKCPKRYPWTRCDAYISGLLETDFQKSGDHGGSYSAALCGILNERNPMFADPASVAETVPC